MKAQAKLYSGHMNNGFMMVDRPSEMYLDYEAKKRVYFDKQSGDYIKQEDFHPSDFEKRQTALDLEDKLLKQDIARQQQIEENNSTGEYAENDPFKPLDDIIVDKKLGKSDPDGVFRDQHGEIVEFPDDELPD